ncbi:MAG: biotin--[Muribaculaceae bacterium]|nr:biotin--[acetyl-CoA-carboxylase] ligase [Muribaculaceae bacterium]
MPRYIHIAEVASTNTYLAGTAAVLPGGTVIYTSRQTAGRGQKGNSWESEPGKNLTFSMLLKRPPVAPQRQFAISEAVSVAIVDVLNTLGDGFAIKWPNDIYWHDRKLAGILIEHSLVEGAIAHSIIGVGLNVNQTLFVSNAPNPVSLAQITGREYDLEALLHQLCERMEALCALPGDEAIAELHTRYRAMLYRADGQPHSFATPAGQPFMATIVDVAPDGMLTLRHDDGTEHSYAFKQVQHIIGNTQL